MKAWGFPGGASGKEPMQEMLETQVPSLGREDPLEEGMATAPIFLPRESQGKRTWKATVHMVAKSWTQLKQLSRGRMYYGKALWALC